MSRFVPFRSRVAVLLAAFSLVLAACSGGSRPAPVETLRGGTQTNDGGDVTVKATWQGPEAGPVFTIAMDTHAVALDGYDLRQLTTLRVDGVEVQATGWEAPKGGHHRSGTLIFPSTTPSGQALISPTTQTVELEIRDVAKVPARTFRWTK